MPTFGTRPTDAYLEEIAARLANELGGDAKVANTSFRQVGVTVDGGRRFVATVEPHRKGTIYAGVWDGAEIVVERFGSMRRVSYHAKDGAIPPKAVERIREQLRQVELYRERERIERDHERQNHRTAAELRKRDARLTLCQDGKRVQITLSCGVEDVARLEDALLAFDYWTRTETETEEERRARVDRVKREAREEMARAADPLEDQGDES